ncbi:glutamate-1-semialdehyde 2,1-aminomutase [Micrococcoides hystricis]|uniref:Glutamate-1-semialdehyde 2,1-aminomutase n=1 Tax=Micrococcoides hystricis TaxID=1572761 RepID=A0ABV6P8B6_9MICC
MTTNTELFSRAQSLMPGGVNSPVRAFGSVGGTPAFMVKADGPLLWDAAGKEYVDLVCSWGPMLLGHQHPAVIKAVHEAVDAGLSFGTSTPKESELAGYITSRVPTVEKVRMVSTGTEATMTAIRLARGYTGRNLIVKFAGCYHGHSDGLLAAAGSGVATLALPGSAGVTEAQASETLVLPYNDAAALEEAFNTHGDKIAAVITESAPCNMGVVEPAEGFNATIRRLTTEHGALMILDEVLTGFRLSEAGYFGLVQDENWAPDIFTFGKVIGGGMPAAALAGRAEVMDFLAPLGPVYQAGTLSGNPVAMAAGAATLANATAEVYEHINSRSAQLQEQIAQALNAAGVNHSIQSVGSLFSVAFGTAENGVRNYADAQNQEVFRYNAFFHSMLEQGVYLPPSVFEAWFVSSSHDDAAMDRIYAALPAAAQAAAAAKAE